MDPEKKEFKKFILKKLAPENIFIGVAILMVVILLINIVSTFNINKELKKGSEAVQEKLKPAKIELYVIRNSRCSDCFDVSTIISSIKNSNFNITKETMLEFNSKEGKEIINKYKIENVPAVIITGDIDKVNSDAFEKKDNALLLTTIAPPYTNALTGKIEGKVTLYILKDSECSKCKDLSTLILQIKSAGIKISEEKNILTNSKEGNELIKKYNIGFVPTIILSKDARLYSIMQQAWSQIGSKEEDGYYVLRLVNPPFINLTTNELKGLVDIVYLTDKTCLECYDANKHKEILTNQQGFAVNFDKEEVYDINDTKGKELIAKYNITQVPTIVLSDDINVYPSSGLLKQFFSIEKDSYYVFRRPQALGSYKDLITNQVVKVQQE